MCQRLNHRHMLSQAVMNQTAHPTVVPSLIILRRVVVRIRTLRQLISRRVEATHHEEGNGHRKRVTALLTKKLSHIGDTNLRGHILWYIHEGSEGVEVLRGGVERGGLGTSGIAVSTLHHHVADEEALTFSNKSRLFVVRERRLPFSAKGNRTHRQQRVPNQQHVAVQHGSPQIGCCTSTATRCFCQPLFGPSLLILMLWTRHGIYIEILRKACRYKCGFECCIAPRPVIVCHLRSDIGVVQSSVEAPILHSVYDVGPVEQAKANAVARCAGPLGFGKLYLFETLQLTLEGTSDCARLGRQWLDIASLRLAHSYTKPLAHGQASRLRLR